MSRVSRAELDQLVTVLNTRLGRPTEPGRAGNLHLQSGYGNGTRLYENLGLGTREVGPRLPASQMADYLRAIDTGIDFAEANLPGHQLPGWEAPVRASEWCGHAGCMARAWSNGYCGPHQSDLPADKRGAYT